MKELIFLIFLGFSLGILLAQNNSESIYAGNGDTLIVTGKDIHFSLTSNGGLTYRIKGHGTYVYQKPYFIINPVNDTFMPRIIHKKRKTNFSKIHVFEDNKPAIVRLSFLDEKGKIVYEAQTTENGTLTLPENIHPVKLQIRDFMQNEFEIKFNPAFDYEINLPGYKIPQGKVILKIKEKNPHHISYILLAEEYKKKINKRNLKKLDKKICKKKKYFYIPVRNLKKLAN